MFKSKLFLKMIVTYFCIIISTLTMLGVLLSFLLNNYLVYNKQMEMLVKSSDISELVRPFLVEKRDPAYLVDLLNRADKKLGTEIWVIDPQGGVIAASADQKMHEGDLIAQEDILELQQGKVSIRQGNSPVYNETVLWVIEPVENNNRVIGGVIVYSPIIGITQTMIKVRNLFLYSAVVSLIFSTVVVYFLSKYVTGPLQDMNRVAQQLACGKLTERVNIKQADEIGDLAKAFNYMAGQIEKQEKMRRDFVADVSHELRSPLTNIQGFIEAMMDGKDKTVEDRFRYLGIIHKETLRVSRLVIELLDLARFDAGTVVSDRKPMDILDVVSNSINKVNPFLQEKNLSLVLNKPEPYQPVMVNANQDRIEQVITNLLDNAIRYAPTASQIQINVRLENGKVAVTVADQGDGIIAEDIPLIWERFYKVDKSRSRGEGGTGLGLAIVKKIVESFGGQVRVASERGQGTEIGFDLPVLENTV
jgi:signal transduction histidine kinase